MPVARAARNQRLVVMVWSMAVPSGVEHTVATTLELDEVDPQNGGTPIGVCSSQSIDKRCARAYFDVAISTEERYRVPLMPRKSTKTTQLKSTSKAYQPKVYKPRKRW